MATSGIDLIDEGLAALAGEDIEGRWLGDELIRVFDAIDRLRAEASRRVGAFDSGGDGHADGHRSTVGWLTGRTRLAAGDASREVRAARALKALPTIKELWEAGETTAAHVTCLARVRARAKADRHFDALEETWAELCSEQEADVLAVALAAFVDRLDNTRPGEDSNSVDAIERRMLVGSHCLGVGLLESRFDTADFETVMNAIDHELALGHVEGDERSIDQQRADALVGICNKYIDRTDPDAENPPVINVILTGETLLGDESGLCQTSRGYALARATVERLCCAGEIGRILVGERDEILNLGRTRRLFDKPQRRAMAHRDRGCCFPGCTRNLRQCEPHHMDPWAQGGHTDLERACLLCWVHHRLVHEQHWTITRTNDGGIDWHRPDGTHHNTWHPPSRPPPIKLIE